MFIPNLIRSGIFAKLLFVNACFLQIWFSNLTVFARFQYNCTDFAQWIKFD